MRTAPCAKPAERDRVYRWRLVELARDAQRSQSLAPELCLAPYPLGAEALASLLYGTHNHAVVFAQSSLITHELYPLVADAFTADSTAVGRAHFNILGVHTDWIDRSHRTQRALFFDFSAQRFVEAPLAVPLPIDSVHFLSLGHGEQTLHAHWSAHLPVFQVNPWAQAQRADDKQATVRAWKESGIDAPATRSITRPMNPLFGRGSIATERWSLNPTARVKAAALPIYAPSRIGQPTLENRARMEIYYCKCGEIAFFLGIGNRAVYTRSPCAYTLPTATPVDAPILTSCSWVCTPTRPRRGARGPHRVGSGAGRPVGPPPKGPLAARQAR